MLPDSSTYIPIKACAGHKWRHQPKRGADISPHFHSCCSSHRQQGDLAKEGVREENKGKEKKEREGGREEVKEEEREEEEGEVRKGGRGCREG